MELNKEMEVLVVDDQQMMRRIVISLLKQLGIIRVREASDGRTALAQLEEGPVDLILSDWNMEGMSGLEFLKAVRADDKYKHLPFIMVTGENKVTNIVAAKEAGVSNYMVKPFSASTLKTKILSVLK